VTCLTYDRGKLGRVGFHPRTSLHGLFTAQQPLRKAGSIARCGQRIGGSDWFCLPAFAKGFVQDHQFVGCGLLQDGG
jgi:hypothetical protein